MKKLKKIRLGVLFGGKSAEHEISIQSARWVVEHADRDKYEIVPIAIDKEGNFHILSNEDFFHDIKDVTLPSFIPSIYETCEIDFELKQFSPQSLQKIVDVVFPSLHGTLGEDGATQGLLKIAEIPFVGPSVLSSSIAMDKDVTKRLLKEAKLPTAKFLTFRDCDPIDEQYIIDTLGLPLFVKPANQGSSIGMTKVEEREELEDAVRTAFQFDRKILIEEKVFGRELECSVLGNEEPIASLPGEIIPNCEFYSYDAKNVLEDGATLETPAKLDQEMIQELQALSIAAFQTLCCEGMARVDFFLKQNGQLIINEVNTIPGFTSISLYPKLWEISGIPYPELIDYLVNLAMERFQKERKLLFKPMIVN
ncbi:MAG: D-alanine--D-alanine ligase [Simkaniaceae bacterium]|nr:D-alanine--D-alanine ligase [Simkaniaceae bacterium]